MTLKKLAADLHLHTVLSPCAEVEMIPPLIVRRALQLGLGLIAVTDHNACFNVEAVRQAAAGTALQVLPGMELQTREEVHLLCLFEALDPCYEWQQEVWAKLPFLTNREEVFGPQFVVDATGEWVRTEERLLATSVDLSLEEAVTGVHRLGGLAIPSHVDRQSFSLLANLGFIPDGLEVDALEVTVGFRPDRDPALWSSLKRWPLLVDGDAHRLEDMQRRTRFLVQDVSLSELLLALKREKGRQVTVQWSSQC